MSDILFKTEEYVFSYRVAGICIQNGKVLLQKPPGEDGYAFPGGHVSFGETNAETLVREFYEETGAHITVGELKWVGEIFFPWGQKPCHQICLYYMVDLQDTHTPREGSFMAQDHLEGRSIPLEFHWITLEKVKTLPVYPTNTKELLDHIEAGIQHFIYQE